VNCITKVAKLILGLTVAASCIASAAPNTAAQQLFDRKCGICHAEGGTGAIMLGRRLGKEQAILARRTDLQGAYVQAIVRTGLLSMPALTRVEVTDPQLAVILSYLTRADSREPVGAAP
jgi:mono/diheme cytochrome c family protein